MASNGASSNVIISSESGHERTVAPVTQVFPPIVELNVGGVFYTTALVTLIREADSLLGQMFSGKAKMPVLRDSKGKFFIDRDGVLFRYILDYLRNQKLVLPENFSEKERLQNEAEYFELHSMLESLQVSSVPQQIRDTGSIGCIVVGYRGSFAFGRDGLADAKFRKLNRLLVCGRITLCREVFGGTLNESRDPDRGAVDRYTSRFFLKHANLEQAFDMLIAAGYKLNGACASSTAGGMIEKRPGIDMEEDRWNHYNEFVWVRQ
ncbi:UNVERIFIED_CONTAM: hypothetical protein RMT77_005612 [Armadillidium vulgare]|nr:BTB/POZ domain-containing protein KCTD16 [Armadillidium vulgare]